MSNLPLFLNKALEEAIKEHHPLLRKFEFLHTEFTVDTDGEDPYMDGSAKFQLTTTQKYHSFIIKLAERLVEEDGVSVQIRQMRSEEHPKLLSRMTYAREKKQSKYQYWRQEVLDMKTKYPITLWVWVNLVED